LLSAPISNPVQVNSFIDFIADLKKKVQESDKSGNGLPMTAAACRAVDLLPGGRRVNPDASARTEHLISWQAG
jgi:hypothetical protein